MDFREFTAGPDDDGRRLDKIIRKFIPELPLGEIYKLIRKGLIKVNSKKTDQSYKILNGDVIKIPDFIINAQEKSDSTFQNITLPPLPPVIFENEHLLILDKPYDMLVHGEKDSLDVIVQKYYETKTKSSSLAFKTGPLHRIDRKTTGLIAFSLSLEGARWFTENLKNHKIQKKYYGIIEGHLENKEIWKDYISKKTSEEEKFHTVQVCVTQHGDEEKEAYTEVTPLKYSKYKNKAITLAEFDIKTGRTHQIRSQSSFHNFPLLGDTAYGGTKISSSVQSHYLQAYHMKLPENNLGIPEIIEIPVSDQILNFFEMKK